MRDHSESAHESCAADRDHDEQDRDVLRAQLVLEGVDSDGLAVASGAACFDFLRVFASNGTHHTLAQVAASPRGYHVNIWLPRRGARMFNVSATLLWSRLDLAGWVNESDWLKHDESGCRRFPVAQPDVLQLSLSAHLPYHRGDAESSLPVSTGDFPVHAKASKATKVNITKCGRDDLTVGIARGFGKSSGEFTPLRCGLPRMAKGASITAKTTTREVIQGKWILFIGASYATKSGPESHDPSTINS